MSLQDILLKLKGKVARLKASGKAQTMTEAETRRLLIDPLIAAIGYDPSDLDQVRLGWRGGKDVADQKEADYALFISGEDKPSVIVEAKRFRADLDKDKTLSQVLTYAYLNGVEWCILTNGHRVAAFHAFEKQRTDRSLFPAFDIELLDTEEGVSSERAAFLLGLLSPDSISSRQPERFKEFYLTYKGVLSELTNLVKRCDPSLARLLRKRLGKGHGTRQIKASLKDLNVSGDEEMVVLSYATIAAPPKPRGNAVVSGKRRKSKRVARWEERNTIVCSAKEDDFQEIFLGENRWYLTGLRERRIPYIKYIAIYRVRPISAITHYAEVLSIEQLKRTGTYANYVISVKGRPKEIAPTRLPPRFRSGVVGGPVYVSLDEILK